MSPQRAARPVRSRRHRYLPPQHGAWAKLLLPYVTAVCVSGLRWPHLPLLGAGVSGYVFSYYEIRDRESVGYLWASGAYHLAALVVAVAAGWGPAVAVVFALLLLRAALLPGRRLAPVRVGIVELVGSLLVFAVVVGHWS